MLHYKESRLDVAERRGVDRPHRHSKYLAQLSQLPIHIVLQVLVQLCGVHLQKVLDFLIQHYS